MSSQVQFPRAAGLLLTAAGVPSLPEALDLSQLRFTFQVVSSDNETPNTAIVRVYNLADSTMRRAITDEFDSLVLQAGYGDNPGIIFKGSIKQKKKGKESNVDSYLELMAADSDEPYNFGLVNQTLKAGSTPAIRITAIAQSMGLPIDPTSLANLTGGILPRGKVLWGLGKSHMRDQALSQNARWSIQNGVMKLIPFSGVSSSTAIAVNSQTGMIGSPEATDNGIEVEMLMNPLVRVGTNLRINNQDIQQFSNPFTQLGYTPPTFVAKVTEDGIYRILAVEHRGDTRGQEWYTRATCLALSSPNSVLAFG